MSEQVAVSRNHPWIILYMTDMHGPKKLKYPFSESTGTRIFPDI